MNTTRKTSADFVLGFATGWPEQQPDIMVLSLTTQNGIQDFAFNKEQALLIAKTIKETAAKLATPKVRKAPGVCRGGILLSNAFFPPVLLGWIFVASARPPRVATVCRCWTGSSVTRRCDRRERSE
jgi:hypothetical protein